MMNSSHLFTLYRFIHSPFITVIRALAWVMIIGLFYASDQDYIPVQFALFFLFLNLIHEIFIHFSLNRMLPKRTVQADSEDFIFSLMLRERVRWQTQSDLYQLVMQYSRSHECRHLLYKLGDDFSLEKTSVTKDDVLAASGKLVLQLGGKYITAIDVVAAYILLSEDSIHALQKIHVPKADFISLYSWLRNHYNVDKTETFHFHLRGPGALDFFVFGWDTQIKEYAQNLTNRVMSSHNFPVMTGREVLYEQLLAALSKDSNNNALLIGDPGTGKTSLVEYFASQSYSESIPAHLNHLTVYELMVDRILSGVDNQGQLEERLQYVLAQISHSGNVIIFIPNLENIFGAGGFNFDLSGVLAPYLQNNALQIIGATTKQGYSQYIERNESMAAYFENIYVDEPSDDISIHMLLQRVGQLEHQHHLSITYGAVKESVNLSKSFYPDKNLPGAAFDLLESTISQVQMSNKKSVDHEDVIQTVEKKTHILIQEPTKDEKQLLMHLEDEIHKRMVNQNQAVTAVASALRRLRSGFSNDKRPISVFLFLGPTGVGKTEMAKALAHIYFQDENNMIRLDMSEYQSGDSIKRLLGEMPGEEYIPNSLSEQIKDHPFSVVLLDEFEKANQHILDMFLQVFDDGRMTTNKGETVSFNHAIIIATSNAGSEFVRQSIGRGEDQKSLRDSLIEHLLQNGLFKPELLNRFDDVIVFKPLTPEHVQQIAALILADVFQKLREKEILLSFDESVTAKIAREGYNEQFGARNIRRYIQDTIENTISKWILEDAIVKNQQYTLKVDSEGNLIVT